MRGVITAVNLAAQFSVRFLIIENILFLARQKLYLLAEFKVELLLYASV